MMLLPLTASVVLVRRERDLEATFNQNAPYLFHQGPGGRVWDQGTRTVQCSRRVDAFKVWVALQRYGTAAFGAIYDHLCNRAAELHRLIGEHPAFEALHEPQSNILCFRYAGDGGFGEAALDDLNLRLRERFNKSGEGWITTTILGGRRVLRVTIMNPRTTEQDLIALLDGLERLASRAPSPVA
jgi:L-2,4-diaminobutyrate decarboxylase